ncbi:plasmolipin-like isoform X2 [Megachile rotundata]|uniref:plasmolipin-like isoform X2 n=1 Tax=Megachile rotundata TaxID=143995 RepID=UPI000614CF18|nr:PREDICTED: uncharacterized protein LOC100882406 isoform X2 [Megachile rotundata]
MMSETVVTMDSSSNNTSNPRQVPTVKTEPGQPNPLASIRLNVPYFRTIPGIIKLVQLTSIIVLMLRLLFYLLYDVVIPNAHPLEFGVSRSFVFSRENTSLHFEKRCIVLGIICMACASPAWLAATHWFLFVAVTAFIASLLWCFVYVLSIREALKLPINWILTELLNTTVFAILYMIAFIAQLSVWSAVNYPSVSRNIAAGVFGIFNTLAYAAGAYFLYVEWKSSDTQ